MMMSYVFGGSSDAGRLVNQGRFVDPASVSILQSLATRNPQRALEIGSGAGNFTSCLRNAVAPDQLICMDLSLESVLSSTKRLGRAVGARSVRVSVGDALALPFRAQFDLITGRFILNYVVTLGDFFKNLRALVNPRGELVFVEWNYEPIIAAVSRRPAAQQLCHEWIMSALASRGVEMRADRAIPAAMLKAGLRPHVVQHRLRFRPTAAASIASYTIETMMALHDVTGIALPIDDVTSFQAELGRSLGKLRVIELSPLLGIAAYVN